MGNHNLRAIGWKPFFQRQVTPAALETGVVARVSAHYSSEVLMLGEAGEFRLHVQLAESAGPIVVGDWLVLDAGDNRAVQRLERQTLLTRKAAGEEVKSQDIAANLDTVFIVSSCNEEFNLSRIERYLALAVQAGVAPVVVLTKADLCDDTDVFRSQVEQLQIGLPVETLDARQPAQADPLKRWCGPGQTVAVLGSSGVGKSTLANTLGVSGLDTGEIREGDSKGRHTTTARSLHLLPGGGVLMDTPGVRELQLPDCEDGIQDVFEDVVELVDNCRFNDCSHESDAGCAIAVAIGSGALDERRYDSFKKLKAEQARNATSLAHRRRRERGTGRMHKSITKHKRHQRED